MNFSDIKSRMQPHKCREIKFFQDLNFYIVCCAVTTFYHHVNLNSINYQSMIRSVDFLNIRFQHDHAFSRF